MDFHEAYTDTCSSVGIAARLGKLDALKKLLSEGKAFRTHLFKALPYSSGSKIRGFLSLE